MAHPETNGGRPRGRFGTFPAAVPPALCRFPCHAAGGDAGHGDGYFGAADRLMDRSEEHRDRFPGPDGCDDRRFLRFRHRHRAAYPPGIMDPSQARAPLRMRKNPELMDARAATGATAILKGRLWIPEPAAQAAAPAITTAMAAGTGGSRRESPVMCRRGSGRG